jgi:hypothetical protein
MEKEITPRGDAFTEYSLPEAILKLDPAKGLLRNLAEICVICG